VRVIYARNMEHIKPLEILIKTHQCYSRC